MIPHKMKKKKKKIRKEKPFEITLLLKDKMVVPQQFLITVKREEV